MPRACLSFARTLPDRYSSAVTSGNCSGSKKSHAVSPGISVPKSRKMIPHSSRTISLPDSPVSCSIYGRSTFAFSARDTVRASCAVSTEVTASGCRMVCLENMSALRFSFPSASSISREQIRKYAESSENAMLLPRELSSPYFLV